MTLSTMITCLTIQSTTFLTQMILTTLMQILIKFQSKSLMNIALRKYQFPAITFLMQTMDNIQIETNLALIWKTNLVFSLIEKVHNCNKMSRKLLTILQEFSKMTTWFKFTNLNQANNVHQLNLTLIQLSYASCGIRFVQIRSFLPMKKSNLGATNLLVKYLSKSRI